MEIDFYKEFANYSTAELLLITREPEKYQSAAIEAAELLLQRRVITPVDTQEADRHISAQADAESVRLKRMNSYKEQVAEVLEPVIVPNTALDPAKWFKLFLWSYGLFYAWVLYKVVKEQVQLFQCQNCKGDLTVWGGLINAIFLTIVFFLLLKNRRWGWILLIVSSISAIITLRRSAWAGIAVGLLYCGIIEWVL